MKAIVFIFLTLLLYPLQAQQLVEIGSGYSGTSVNTTIFRNNSIVTHKQNQYAAYYDSEGYVVIAKRKLGKTEWELNKSQYKGNIRDAHNVISLMVDGEGYLHVSFDHHGHPLRYCRSVAPESTTLDELELMLGSNEQDVTYPEFYTLKNGNLLFAYRSGASGRGNLVLNKYNVKERRWERVQDILIDGENKRNAYWQLYVDDKGTIHLSFVWRETWMVETNHDLGYARSMDDGKTWCKSDGTRYSLPITMENAEYAWRIPENSELINQTSMSADANGNPYIATYWRDADSDVPQYRLVWHDGTAWHSSQVTQRTAPFTLKGGGTKMIPIARPRMVAYKNKAFYLFRDEERGSKVSMAYTTNLQKGEWKVVDLTDFPVHAWEPSLDSELWKKKQQLHIFVQETHQGDGERTV
ncbi:MAG: BNR repeat-containing protein, partial [Phocaeicola sp.]